jgi:hypothetical protein
MIHTDGRPTIANAVPVPGQMTVDECIEEAAAKPSCEELWDQVDHGVRRLREELDPAEPIYGGY